MVEDIIETYKRECTRIGQFDYLLNPWVMLLSILMINVMLNLIVLRRFYIILPDVLSIYLMTIIFVCILFIYCVIVQMIIFHICKKYIIKKIALLIETEQDEVTKNLSSEKLIIIKKSKYRLKYTLNYNPIEKIYYKIKFDEFLSIAKIDSQRKVNKLNDDLREYSKNKDSYKEVINSAFFVTLFTIIIKPIIEYLQNIYIPVNSSEMNLMNLISYIACVTQIIFIALLVHNMIYKLNDSRNIKLKRILFRLSDSLEKFDINTNKLEKYLQVELENK